MRKDFLLVAMLLLPLLSAGCAAENPESKQQASSRASSSSSAVPDVMAEPVIDSTFSVGPDALQLMLRCFGKGSPTIMFDTGSDSAGTEDFDLEFLRPLAEQNVTCVYDRLGTGSSDAPIKQRRTADDVAADLQALLEAAKVPSPYTLVGSSGGGNIAVQYALRHPEQIAGLVLLDVPAPNPNLEKELPGAQGYTNPENIDWVVTERQQSQMKMPIGKFPVLIVTAESGQGGERNQAHWLKLSPNARQVVSPGGHDIYQDDPDGIAELILSMV